MRRLVLFLILQIFMFISACSSLINTTPTSTPEPTQTPTHLPTALPTPNPLQPVNGRLLFNIISKMENSENKYKSIGAFVFDLKTQKIEQIFQDDFLIADVSNDGNKILFTNNNELYLFDLSNKEKYLISDFLFVPNKRGSHIPNTTFIEESNQIAFIGQEPQNEFPKIYISDIRGEEINPLPPSGTGYPHEILGYRDNSIYWMQWSERSLDTEKFGEDYYVYHLNGIEKTSINGGVIKSEIEKLTYDFYLSNDGNILIYSPAIGSLTGSLPPTIYIKNYSEDKELVLMGNEQSLDPDLDTITKAWKDDYNEQIEIIWSPKSNFFLLNLTVYDKSGNNIIPAIRKVYTKEGEPVFPLPMSNYYSGFAFSVDENHVVINSNTALEFCNFPEGRNLYNLSKEYIFKDLLNLDYPKSYIYEIYFIP